MLNIIYLVEFFWAPSTFQMIFSPKLTYFRISTVKAYPSEVEGGNLRRQSPSKDSGYDDWDGKSNDKSIIAHLPVDLLERT